MTIAELRGRWYESIAIQTARRASFVWAAENASTLAKYPGDVAAFLQGIDKVYGDTLAQSHELFGGLTEMDMRAK